MPLSYIQDILRLYTSYYSVTIITQLVVFCPNPVFWKYSNLFSNRPPKKYSTACRQPSSKSCTMSKWSISTTSPKQQSKTNWSCSKPTKSKIFATAFWIKSKMPSTRRLAMCMLLLLCSGRWGISDLSYMDLSSRLIFRSSILEKCMWRECLSRLDSQFLDILDRAFWGRFLNISLNVHYKICLMSSNNSLLKSY